MRIFIDTEFTDYANPELISIGLVTDDGAHEFYAELPVNKARCNDFVLSTVLPQLAQTPEVLCSTAELEVRLRTWLGQFELLAPVTICYDYSGDWQLLCGVMQSGMPAWIRQKNINQQIDPVALQKYFVENRLKEHHALNDAKANRHAYDPMRGV